MLMAALDRSRQFAVSIPVSQIIRNLPPERRRQRVPTSTRDSYVPTHPISPTLAQQRLRHRSVVRIVLLPIGTSLNGIIGIAVRVPIGTAVRER